MTHDAACYRRRGEAGTLRLAGDVAIPVAAAVHAAAQRAAEDARVRHVRADLEHVTRLDSSVLQVLIALKHDLAASDRTMETVGASGAVALSLAMTGLTRKD